MSTSHLDRKELKRPDVFQEVASPVFNFLGKHTKALIAAGVLALVIFAALLGYSSLKSKKEAEANSALFIARKAFVVALEKTNPAKTGPDKTAADTVKSDTQWDQTVSAELEHLNKFTKDFKGTHAAFEALLIMGDAYFDHNQYAKAGEYYDQALKAAPSRSMKALAEHSAAYAYENAKQYDKAIESLKHVLTSGDKPLKGDTLMALARNFASKGDKTKAAEYYDQVTKDFANSPLAKSAESQKTQLGLAK